MKNFQTAIVGKGKEGVVMKSKILQRNEKSEG